MGSILLKQRRCANHITCMGEGLHVDNQERRKRIIAARLAEAKRTGVDPYELPSLCGAPREDAWIPKMKAVISREAMRSLAGEYQE